MRFKVIPGVAEPMSALPGHRDVEGIERFKLLDQKAILGSSFHVAFHVVTADYQAQECLSFTDPESHPFDEVNLLLPGAGGLHYRYEIDGEDHFVEAPCTVFIASGTEHRMEPVAGTGSFICIHLDAEEG